MSTRKNEVVAISAREATLKRKIRRHLSSMGFTKGDDGTLSAPGDGKEAIRLLHEPQRGERLDANAQFLRRNAERLLGYFASGTEVDPDAISPALERIASDTWQSDLFRLASLTWSVPVSRGFGRRLRYLVWDQNNGKLIGLLAIGDPVFNLSARDTFIGWNYHARSKRLANLMDAYVVGAVPPYNMLLGGKLVACLLRSRDIYDDFAKAYGSRAGIISEEHKRPRLLAITTSSSMGRSSVYNRLKLEGIQYLTRIGFTGGWGHFHIPDTLFQELREYLRALDHPYTDAHQYGGGPNWRLRTTRAALAKLGIRNDLLCHGVRREVFISCLATNAQSILRTGKGRPNLSSLHSVDEISGQALDRWLRPRARRRPEFREWQSQAVLDLLKSSHTKSRPGGAKSGSGTG